MVTGRGSERRQVARPAMAVLSALLAVMPVSPAQAEEPVFESRASRNLFGMTGLIDMPSAGMQQDGEFALTTAYHGAGFFRGTISAQILPWLEGAFRYAAIDEGLADGETLYDRSFDLKLRLVEEGPSWPAVALGLQDFLGTGVYSGEYLVATKSFLDGDLSITGGVGWGRFSGEFGIDNPLGAISERFDTRERDDTLGGEVNFNQFFRGEDMGFFGGVEYRTPVEGLRLKAELSPDTYDRERRTGDYEQGIPLNFGIEYRPWGGVEIGAYALYGRDFGLRLTLSGNPLNPLVPDDAEPGPLPLVPRAEQEAWAPDLGSVREVFVSAGATTAVSSTGVSDIRVADRAGLRWATVQSGACDETAAIAIDAEAGLVDAVTFVRGDGTVLCTVVLRPDARPAVRDALRAAEIFPIDWHGDGGTPARAKAALVETLATDGITLFGFDLQPRAATVWIENARFRETPRAIGRTARAMTRTLPPSVETFEIVPVEGGVPVVSILLSRSDLEDQVNRPEAARQSWLSAGVGEAALPDWNTIDGTPDLFPRYSWSLNPTLPISLFDPDEPVRFDLAAQLNGRVEFAPGLSVNGTVRKQVFGNLDEARRDNDSELPRVRSDIGRYLSEGDPAITRLTGDWITKLDDDIYARLSAGYLELMHAGVSGEVLWKPVDQPWGLGGELNWTKQRDFDGFFGFRDHEVVTGHASLYLDTGWNGLFAQIDAGRYLARDWGGTFTLTRRFANGWEMGGFFTLTDVPFEKFGEGSFDKGLILKIPFNWALPYESRSALDAQLRPLTRDGGQRLSIANRLYDTVEDFDRSGLKRQWKGFWE